MEIRANSKNPVRDNRDKMILTLGLSPGQVAPSGLLLSLCKKKKQQKKKQKKKQTHNPINGKLSGFEKIVYMNRKKKKKNHQQSKNKPLHDKTNKMPCAPSEDQISLGIRPVWSVVAVRMKKAWALSYLLSAQQRLWSDWADVQADLSFRCANMPFCWFCHVP